MISPAKSKKAKLSFKDKTIINTNNNVILAVMNHSPLTIIKYLNKLDKEYLVYSSIKKKSDKELKKKVQNKHILFNGQIALGEAYERGLINCTPLIWESANVTEHMALNANIQYIDAKVFPDGIIYFEQNIDKKRFKTLLESPWKKDPKSSSISCFNKVKSVQFGLESTLSDCIDSILFTLPSCCHKPFMVAFVNGLESPKVFSNFLKNNRLIAPCNKKHFSRLNDILAQLDKPIKKLLKCPEGKLTNEYNSYVKTLDKEDVLNLRRIRLYRKSYFSYNLKDFLDSEKNIKEISN